MPNWSNVLQYDKFHEEMTVFLRNNLTDPSSRGTAGSNVFTAGGASGNFTLSQVGVKNITSATVGGVAQAAYTDYTPNYQNASPTSNPTVTFSVVPTSGAQVIINYKYGDTWIYPDWPRTDLGLTSYPRVSADIINKRTEPFGIGGKCTLSDIMYSVTAFADKSSTVDSIMTELGSIVTANTTTFYNFQAIYQSNMSPLLKEPERHDKIVFRTMDFIVPSRVEK